MVKKLSKLEVIGGHGEDHDEIFVVLDGVRIARRGYPGTPEAGTWVSLVPGWIVRDDFDKYGRPSLELERQGGTVH
jgi:hypothetical protein